MGRVNLNAAMVNVFPANVNVMEKITVETTLMKNFLVVGIHINEAIVNE